MGKKVCIVFLLLSLLFGIPVFAVEEEPADPVIHSDLPLEKTVDYGESSTIGVSASVAEKYSVRCRWYVDGKLDESVTSTSYNLKDLPVGSHKVYCLVYGERTGTMTGETFRTSMASSRACSVTVLPAIQEEYGESESVRSGESFLLKISVSVSEGYTLTYQWYVDGNEDKSSVGPSFDTKDLPVGTHEVYCRIQTVNSQGFSGLKGDSETCYVSVSPADTGSMERFVRGVEYRDGSFGDIAATDWFYGYVRDAYEMGLISGKGEGRFAPNEPFTLAEAVKIASCIHSIYYTGTAVSSPLNASPWYVPYVNYATRNGILETTDFSDFSKPCNRAQMAYIFSRALPEMRLTPLRSVEKIPDCDKTVKYYDNILTLYEAGVVSGDTAHRFHPYSEIKRSEAAKIICTMVLPELRDSVSF